MRGGRSPQNIHKSQDRHTYTLYTDIGVWLQLWKDKYFGKLGNINEWRKLKSRWGTKQQNIRKEG